MNDTLAKKDEYKFSRLLYIIEAALEYFISLMFTGAYIAKIATAIGMDSSTTAILTSFVALGQCFQIFAIFLANKKPVRHWVTALHIVSQVVFGSVYLLPVFDIPDTVKHIMFFVFLIVAYFLHNLINSPKINWFMSLVPHDKVGVFTANKEIVSLFSGMAFTFVMGTVIDAYEAVGDLTSAFIFGAISIFVIALFHTLTLVFSKEKPVDESALPSTKGSLKAVLKNKFVWKIVLMSALFGIATHISVPFYGTYQTIELGFSMTFVSIINIVHALARALVSRKIGEFGNKTSFTNSLSLCYGICLVAFAINIFTTPSNGHILFTIYFILYGVASAGMTSGQLNLVYAEVEENQRTQAYALLISITGLSGFLSTVAVTPLFDFIQANGNTIFGIPVYAQQVLSLIASIMMLITILYLNLFVRKKKPKTEQPIQE